MFLVDGWVVRTWMEENRKTDCLWRAGLPVRSRSVSCSMTLGGEMVCNRNNQREQAAVPDLSLPPRLLLACKHPQHRCMGMVRVGMQETGSLFTPQSVTIL